MDFDRGSNSSFDQDPATRISREIRELEEKVHALEAQMRMSDSMLIGEDDYDHDSNPASQSPVNYDSFPYSDTSRPNGDILASSFDMIPASEPFSDRQLPSYVSSKKSTVQKINCDKILETPASNPINVESRYDDFFNKPTLQPDSQLDSDERRKWIDHKQTSTQYKDLWKERKHLPIYSENILDRVVDELKKIGPHIVFLNGILAAGKTTQLPQWLLDNAIMIGRASQTYILVALPTNLGVWALAKRVAEERGQQIGDQVGYKTSLQFKLPGEQGSILFATYNSLRLWLEHNPGMENVSHIILDEVDERDRNIDKCLRLLEKNFPPKLKVVMVSTREYFTTIQNYFSGVATSCAIDVHTMEAKLTYHYLPDIIQELKFKIPDRRIISRLFLDQKKKNYFHCPSIKIDKQTFLMMKLKKDHNGDDYYSRETIKVLRKWNLEKHPGLEIEVISRLATYLSREMDAGNKDRANILIFMPEYETIKQVADRINQLKADNQNYSVSYMHSLFDMASLQKIFQPSEHQKIIVASNIAETSITIPNVCYIIDCGMTKLKLFDSAKNIESFRPHRSARYNTMNRARAAGRMPGRVGHVYRIFTQYVFDQMKPYHPPELARISLANELLELKLKNEIPRAFFDGLPTPPPPDTLLLAAQDLVELDLVYSSTGHLTALGRMASKLVSAVGDLRHTTMLIMGLVMCCVNPIVTIVSFLSLKDPFRIRLKEEIDLSNDQKVSEEIARVEAQIAEFRKEFARGSHSDHIMFLNIMDEFLSKKSEDQQRKWAVDHYIDFTVMKKIVERKNSLIDDLKRKGILRKNYRENEYWLDRRSKEISTMCAVICRALGTSKIAEQQHTKTYKIAAITRKAHTQQASVNYCPFRRSCRCEDFNNPHHRYLLFDYAHFTENTTILHETTALGPLTLMLFGARKLQYDDRNHVLVADEFKFDCDKAKATQLMAAKKSLEEFIGLQINHLTRKSNVTHNWKHLGSVFEMIRKENESIMSGIH